MKWCRALKHIGPNTFPQLVKLLTQLPPPEQPPAVYVQITFSSPPLHYSLCIWSLQLSKMKLFLSWIHKYWLSLISAAISLFYFQLTQKQDLKLKRSALCYPSTLQRMLRFLFKPLLPDFRLFLFFSGLWADPESSWRSALPGVPSWNLFRRTGLWGLPSTHLL